MKFHELLQKRRSHYALTGEVSLSNEELEALLGEVLEATPSAFNVQSARVLLLLDEASKSFWDEVNATFDNSIDEAKFKGFYDAKGTVLFFIDHKGVQELQESFPAYAENFPRWAHHENAMVQENTWVALRQEEIGASLQHYNPVIDGWVKERYDLPESYELVAQMPFGGIVAEPEAKEKLEKSERVRVVTK